MGPGPAKRGDINLLTTYPDKAQMRNILAYETYRDADCPDHWVFPVRVQQNGAFWGTAHMHGERRQGLAGPHGPERRRGSLQNVQHLHQRRQRHQRRRKEDPQERGQRGPAGAVQRRHPLGRGPPPIPVRQRGRRRGRQLPGGAVLTGDTDCCHKNYYFYRDTGRSDEWQMWPWDVDSELRTRVDQLA